MDWNGTAVRFKCQTVLELAGVGGRFNDLVLVIMLTLLTYRWLCVRSVVRSGSVFGLGDAKVNVLNLNVIAARDAVTGLQFIPNMVLQTKKIQSGIFLIFLHDMQLINIISLE